MVLGVLVLFYLPDGPDKAVWLEVDERDALSMRLDIERGRSTQKRQRSFRKRSATRRSGYYRLSILQSYLDSMA